MKSDVEKIKESFEDLARSWDSAFVARTQLSKFSGGLLNPRTLSTLDCRGKGPFKIKVGRNVVYPKRDLINWLIQRSLSDWYRNKAYKDKGLVVCVAENASGQLISSKNHIISTDSLRQFCSKQNHLGKLRVNGGSWNPPLKRPLYIY